MKGSFWEIEHLHLSVTVLCVAARKRVQSFVMFVIWEGDRAASPIFSLLFSPLGKNIFCLRVRFECIRALGFEWFSLHYCRIPSLVSDFLCDHFCLWNYLTFEELRKFGVLVWLFLFTIIVVYCTTNGIGVKVRYSDWRLRQIWRVPSMKWRSLMARITSLFGREEWKIF